MFIFSSSTKRDLDVPASQLPIQLCNYEVGNRGKTRRLTFIRFPYKSDLFVHTFCFHSTKSVEKHHQQRQQYTVYISVYDKDRMFAHNSNI